MFDWGVLTQGKSCDGGAQVGSKCKGEWRVGFQVEKLLAFFLDKGVSVEVCSWVAIGVSVECSNK